MIDQLHIRPLEIPFKSSFEHSSAERSMTQAVLVHAQTNSGHMGLGEGCPREYVTGETVDSCTEFFHQVADQLKKEVRSMDELRSWTELHKPVIDKNPAAWCAIELAILDAFSKDQQQSLEAGLGLPELEGVFTYSAVIGISDESTMEMRVLEYAKSGFTDVKVKVTGNPATDNITLNTIREYIPGATIRMDANNLWTDPSELLHYLIDLDLKPGSIEEPFRAGDLESVHAFTEQTEIPVILDESFYRAEHFQSLPDNTGHLIINLRVSKMGGVLRSLDIAEQSREKGIPLIIGAQVGETSILTRAGLTLANACRDQVLAMEGAFGTLLLEEDISEQPLMFGNKGILDPAVVLSGDTYGSGLAYTSKFSI